MTALPPDAVADLYKVVAELEQRLESSFAAHDAAIARQAAMDAENGRLIHELSIARERQNASADILSTIASVSGDAERALYQIAETSARLFDAPSSTIHIAEGDGWAKTIRVGESSRRVGAGVPETQLQIGGRNMPGTIVGENRQVHVPDVDNVDPEIADWPGLPYLRAAGTRSMSGSPLRCEGKAIGALIVYRDQLAPFTEDELALQQSFADQAAIAIENSRLFRETREALERQTATAEILKIIAASPSDAQPVFDAIADSAKRLLGGFSATVLRFLGDELHLVAYTPTDPAADEGLKASFPRSISEFPTFALVRNGETVQFPDSEAEQVPELNRELARLRGFRSVLFTPLMNRGVPVGMISVTRAEPGAFAADHVQLLQTFADQAVIAIENARLFNETRQALERQTATAEVLKVIAGSPSAVQPVFDAIVTSANRLIGGFSTAMFRFVDGQIQLSAFTPTDPAGDAVLQSSFPMPLGQFPPYQLVLNGAPAELVDTELEPAARDIARARGYRSMLFAPLMNEGKAVGIITVTRRAPGSFGEPHVRLLQMFAAQSVIAMENVRLFNETREALEQQKASADILRVVSSSVADTQPVFDEILRSIEHLFGGDDRFIYLAGDDGLLHIGAAHGANAERVRALYPVPLEGTASEVAFRERRLIHYADVYNDPDVPSALREIARRIGKNYSMALAPMLWEGRAIGSIFVGRTSMKAFSEKECSLLCSFADQAVIAIQNARLFNEVRQRTEDLSEALQQQTATADVLKVISRSAFDLQTVLDTLVESASRLCDADRACVFQKSGELFHRVSNHGFSDELIAYANTHPFAAGTGSTTSRVALEGKAIHNPDVLADPNYKASEYQRLGNHRTMLGIPLLREGAPIGVFLLAREQVRPFTDRQIELVTSFADQAVIAIENVRLFDEVQAKTRDLTEALTYQTGSANILKVIASSPTDVAPVLTAIVESACELCDANDAIVYLKEGDQLSYEAHHGPIPVVFGEKRAINRDYVAGRSVVDRMPVHVHDVFSEEGAEFPEARELSRSLGIRSILCVPMLRENESIGAILLRRTEVQPFNDKQIALLQTFANQAVIAIGNVRLFEEVQQRTRDLSEALQQQTATSDVLKVISRSAFDLQMVLDTLVESAARLCESDKGVIFKRDGDLYRWSANFGNPPELETFAKANPFKPGRYAVTSRVALEGKTFHVADVLADPEYGASQYQKLGGYRTILCVPLLREGVPIGVFALTRSEVKPFTERQIELVQSFADQAVIAIENVRLFDEVQTRTKELAASLDDLRTAQERLVQTEKLASLGQLTAGIAHEIKNPLNFVNNFAALSAELTDELNDVLKPADISDKIREEVNELTGLLKDNLQKVVQHGKRADSIVKNMLLHSREGGGDHRPADINALIDESLNLAYHGARAERADFNVTLQRDFDANAGMVEVFPQEISRVFLNLISNGFYAVNKRRIEAGQAGFDPVLIAATRNLDDAVEIRIRDNGIGIPPEVKDKMFNPFFTTKPAGEGTGLGLSMSHDIIVKQHGGTIDVDTEPGQFTEFRIVLPRTSNPRNKGRGST